jgi:hypothetical protein
MKKSVVLLLAALSLATVSSANHRAVVVHVAHMAVQPVWVYTYYPAPSFFYTPLVTYYSYYEPFYPGYYNVSYYPYIWVPFMSARAAWFYHPALIYQPVYQPRLMHIHRIMNHYWKHYPPKTTHPGWYASKPPVMKADKWKHADSNSAWFGNAGSGESKHKMKSPFHWNKKSESPSIKSEKYNDQTTPGWKKNPGNEESGNKKFFDKGHQPDYKPSAPSNNKHWNSGQPDWKKDGNQPTNKSGKLNQTNSGAGNKKKGG